MEKFFHTACQKKAKQFKLGLHENAAEDTLLTVVVIVVMRA